MKLPAKLLGLLVATAAAAGAAIPVGTNFLVYGTIAGADPTRPYKQSIYDSAGAEFATTTDPWNPNFLKEIEIYPVLRFMDWGRTNNSPTTTWNNRRQKTAVQDLTWANKIEVAYEWWIDLANKADKDMWINIPHLIIPSTGVERGSNDFIRKFAILIKTGVDMRNVTISNLGDLSTKTRQDFINAGGVATIDPLEAGRKVYIEYGNETWNPTFDEHWQWMWVEAQKLNLSTDSTIGREKYHAWAAARMFKEFADVFGTNSNRIVRVSSIQTTSGARVNYHLEVYRSATLNPTGLLPDGFASTFYFGRTLDGADAAIVTKLKADIDSEFTNKWSDIRAKIDAASAVDGKTYKYFGYEGGQHLKTNSDKAVLKPGMKEVYAYMLSKIEQVFDLAMHYTHDGGVSAGNSWGAVTATHGSNHPQSIATFDAMRAANPRYDALYVYATSTKSAPTITAQPQAASKTVGESHTFSVTATGNPAPTYQWRKGTTNISGATGSTYTIASLVAGDAGNYSVVVTNSEGTVTSNSAALTVSAANTAPAFTTQPVGASKVVGESVTFTVAVSGNPTPTLQWRKDGTNILNATGTSLTLSNLQTSDAATYTVVATNSVNSVTSNNAVLTVTAAPTGGTPVLFENDNTKFAYSTGWYSVGLGSASGGTIQSVANSTTATATLTPGLAGTYEIEIFQPTWSRSSTGVPVVVNHSGGAANFTVNQAANAGAWVKLGTSYTLTTASTIVVRGAVTQDTDITEERAMVDAIRLTPVSAPAEPTGPYYEAEDYDNTTGVAPWTKAIDTGAANGSYVVVPEGSTATVIGGAPATGYLDYNFTTTAAGPIYIYLKVRETAASSNGSDSLYIDILNDGVAAFEWSSGFTTNDVFYWREWTTGKPTSLPAGNHTLRIHYREDGFQIDRIAISATVLNTTGQ